MIYQQLTTLLGFECSALNDEGTVAYIATPFRFADGDPIPVYVEVMGEHVRFFDDGEVFLHFRGRGLELAKKRQAKFISKAATNNNVACYDDLKLQVIDIKKNAALAFGRYISAMHEICAWERENEGINEDGELLVEEVVMAIQAANPHTEIQRDQSFTTISKKKRTLPIVIDGVGIAVANPHHASVNSALYTIVDIQQSPENMGKKFMFIINDKADPNRARADAAVLQAAAPVRMLSDIEKRSFAIASSTALH